MDNDRKIRDQWSLGYFIALVPFVGQYANDGNGSESQVNDTGVQGLCRLFAQLLRSFGADGALRSCISCRNNNQT